jgi:hypothetical protein
MPRITVYLQVKERDALFRLAQRERRKTQEQGALLIRRELETLGLLPADLPHNPQPQPAEVCHVQA